MSDIRCCLPIQCINGLLTMQGKGRLNRLHGESEGLEAGREFEEG